MGLYKKAVKGVGWMGGLRLVVRGLTLLRTIILARLLLPSQFGVFGLVTLTISLFEILTETGINTVLIQEEKKIKPLLNTAWTISIGRGFLITVLISLSAFPLARFFSTPEAVSFLLLASLVPLIKGMINPAIVIFQKKLQFKKEFLFRTFIILIESLIAIIGAYQTRSVGSLIFAMIFGAFLEVVLSFIFCKPWPTLAWDKMKVKKIVSSGKWVTLTGIFSCLVDQGDDAVVGKVLGMQSLGLYQMAYKISNLPFTEISDVFSQVTFPVYSIISKDKERVKKAFFKTLLATALLVVPGVVVIFLFPELIIKTILGENWLKAASALKILALFGLSRAISGSAGPILYAFKRQDLVAKINLAKLIVLSILIFPLTKQFNLEGTSWAVLISSLIIQPLIWQSIYLVLVDKRLQA